MSRSAVVVLAVMVGSSSALARIPYGSVGVYQTQNYVGAIANPIKIDHGHVGTSTASLRVNNSQTVTGNRHFFAAQGQHAVLMQVGSAHVDGGHVSIRQDLGSAGGQIQAVGSGFSPKYQAQTNILSGKQTVTNTGGQGTGNAYQVGTVRSNQISVNAAGSARQSSTLRSLQNASYTGGRGDTGKVTSTVVAATEQQQFVY